MTKRILSLTAILVCALALTSQAGEAKHKSSKEADATKAALLEKYDTNKDGKLDKTERAKMSKEDKKRAKKAGLGNKHAEKHSEQKN